MTSSACSCSRPLIVPRSISPAVRFGVVPRGSTSFSNAVTSRRSCRIKASIVDSYESSSNFVKRMEQTWLISQQPRPVSCSSCESNGHVERKWCRGTGFFILGDNMLCQVPSRNTTCVICAGKVSASFYICALVEGKYKYHIGEVKSLGVVGSLYNEPGSLNL